MVIGFVLRVRVLVHILGLVDSLDSSMISLEPHEQQLCVLQRNNYCLERRTKHERTW